MSNNSQNAPHSNHKIFSWLISKGSVIADCLLKVPSLMVQAGKFLFHIEDHVNSLWNHSKETMQMISKDFKEFLQVAQKPNLTDEELTLVQEKLAHDIAECLKQNVDIVCQMLTVGVALFDCVNQLKELFFKIQNSLQEIYQESRCATNLGVNFISSEANKAIKCITKLFPFKQDSLVNVSTEIACQIEFPDMSPISITITEVEDDESISSESATETLLHDCETMGESHS